MLYSLAGEASHCPLCRIVLFPKPNQLGNDETDSSDDSVIPDNFRQTLQELAMLDP